MRTRSSARRASSSSEVARLQERLAFRLLLVFLVPLLVIALLGVYAYRLSARVQEVEILERVSYVDRVYRDTHNVSWALAEYRVLAEQYPRNPRIYVRLGALHHEKGEDQESVKYLKDAIALKPSDWEAYSTLAYVELSRRNERAAIEAGEAALRHNPVETQTYNNLAWIYATSKDDRIRDLAKAEDYASKAVAATRCQQKDYLDTLAVVYRRTNRAEHAADVASSSGLCRRSTVASATPEGR